MNEISRTIGSETGAFCLIQKQDSDEIIVLTGEPVQCRSLVDIPRKSERAVEDRRYDTISMVPFSQIRERGFTVHDEGEPIRTIRVASQRRVLVEQLLCQLPRADVLLDGDIVHDSSDEEYAEVIRRIIAEEIGEGEGANFVVPRRSTGRLAGFSPAVAATIFTNLVRQDYGSYWKYLFYDTQYYFVGSTPERHLSVEGGRVKMNPISGTFRKEHAYECRAHFKSELLSFLRDPKEIEELFMVVDEELTMMAAI